MEDLSAMLQSLLSDPDTVQKLRGKLSELGVGESEQAEPSPVAESDAPDLSALLQLAPLLRNAASENDDTRLLHALRPYLNGARAKRLEQAQRMLRLRGLLPLLQQSGLLTTWMGGSD